MSDFDILIAGGGSVGLATASALSRAGFSVALIERSPQPPRFLGGEIDARVYALAPASAEFLATLDAWEPIIATRAAAYRGMEVWRDSPAQALKFSGDSWRHGGALGWIVEHSVLNAVLWAGISGVAVRLGHAVVAVTADEGHCQVTLANGQSLSAKLLIVADGPDSPIRSLLGLEASGWDYPQRALVCHVASEKPHQGVARQRFLPTGPLALLPLNDGRCSVVWSADTAQAQTLADLDDAGFMLALEQASQSVLGAFTSVTPRLGFDLRLRYVTQAVTAGAVLIGDAAHVVHPLAGQGVNLGLLDAAALVRTLMLARDAGRGWWRERSLREYQRQRSADVQEMLMLTDGLYRGFGGAHSAIARCLGWGLAMANRVEPAKRFFAQKAQG